MVTKMVIVRCVCTKCQGIPNYDTIAVEVTLPDGYTFDDKREPREPTVLRAICRACSTIPSLV
jgi:hypothetical protein